MARAIWKGAISFGLVHVPVALYPASHETGIDFDWIDKRSMDPVGYKKVNKRTGKEVEKDDIVRGVKVDGDRYVVLGDDEIKAAYPKTTQTIAIEAFVKAGEIPFTQLEKPYYLAPVDKDQDQFTHAVQALVAKRVGAGETAEVEPMEDVAPAGSNVVDLTELLARSLGKRGGTSKREAGKTDAKSAQHAEEAPAAKNTRRAPTAKKSPPTKRASKTHRKAA